MLRIRSILPLILVLVATVLVSCGGPNAVAPPTYTPEKIAQIQKALTPIEKVQERMPELGSLIADEDWVYVDNLIHGPFGQLRSSMSYLASLLLPKDQPQARDIAKDITKDLENIDAAAKAENYPAAQRAYSSVLVDFDTLSDILPADTN